MSTLLKVLTSTFLFLFFLIPSINAQDICGSAELHEEMMRTNTVYKTEYVERQAKIRNKVIEKKLLRQRGRQLSSNQLYTIPVVVHVIHLGETEGTGSNISDTQISDALDGLNERFSNTIGSGLDIEVQFCLAQRTPDGCPTDGINRVDGSGLADYTSDGIESSSTCTGADEEDLKDLSIWPRGDYYNIWVVHDICGNVAGYAYYPTTYTYDGAVMRYDYMTYSGATLAHELGHGFDLAHTFNDDDDGANCPPDNDCTVDGDMCCDTPPHKRGDCGGSNPCSGSGTWLNSRNNYMSYCHAYRDLFTSDQKDRVRSSIEVGLRASLITSAGCTPLYVDVTASWDTICPGGTTVLTASGEDLDTYLWSTGASTQSITVSPGSDITYSVTATSDGSCTITNSKTIVVTSGSFPQDNSNINGNTDICTASPETYFVSVNPDADSYLWAYSGSGTITGSGASITLQATSSGTLYSAAINECGSGDSSSLSITILENSSSSITEYVCESYIAPDGQVFDTTGVYTAIMVNNEGCDSIITINLIVSSASEIMSDGDVTVCPGAGSQTLSVTVPSGVTVDWYDAATNGNILASNSTTYSTSSSGTYFAQASSSISLAVGDTFGGGIIAYIYDQFDPGYNSNGIQGIIVSLTDQGLASWGCRGSSISTSNNIGEGFNNTQSILASCSESNISAQVCDDYVSGLYEDWFLPSRFELNELYNNKAQVGNYVNNLYASSTQYDNDNNLVIDFTNGTTYFTNKNGSVYVRPVRYFDISNSTCENSNRVGVTLNINSDNDTIINESICDGESYFGYTTSGQHIDSYTDAFGCDSSRTINLTVLDTALTILNQTICEGQSYAGYSAGGTFTDVFIGSNSCDSTRVLNLTVLDTVLTTINQSICEGETYGGYNSTGTFTDVYTGLNTCDSTRVLNLTVNDTVLTTVNQEICEGDTYAGYSSGGTYTDVFTGANSCDSTRVLNLTVLDTILTTINQSICEGEAYGGYNSTGTFTDVYTGSNTCDSTRVLNLTVLDTVLTVLNETICYGDSYAGYNSTGTHTDIFTGVNSCDSTRILNLAVLDTTLIEISQVICEGDSYEGYTASGTYVNSYIANNGCDSTRVISLTVKDTVLTVMNKSICYGASYAGYSVDGSYYDVYTGSNGCDSTRQLNLTVNDTILENLTVSICDGDSYAGYSSDGTYTDVFTGSNGCDSTRVLSLSVLDTVLTTINQTICEGESFAGYSSTGSYDDFYLASSGCDSLRTLNLTVNDTALTTVSQEICEGDTYAGYSSGGTYTDVFTGSNTCDSTRVLNLTVLDTVLTTINQSICEGEAYGGYNSTGTFTDVYTGMNTCDSTRVLNLTVLDTALTVLNETICYGDSYAGYNSTGTHTDIFTGVNSCDSTRILNLTVLDTTLIEISQVICEGDSYEGYTSSGTYIDSYTASNGCDSTRVISLTVKDTVLTVMNKSICYGASYAGYSVDGSYYDVYTGSNGCDSTRQLNLTVNDTILENLTVSICDGDSYAGYSSDGTYTDVFTGSNGCDSTRILSLSVLDTVLTTINQTICEGESFAGYSSTGSYDDFYLASSGCDSLRTLNLTVNDTALTTVSQEICEGDTYAGYSSGGTYTDVFTGANSCDSTRVLNLTVLDTVVSTMVQNICTGESFAGYNSTGVYSDIFTGLNGCDSTRILNLTVLDTSVTHISAEVCPGSSFAGYNSPGTYTDILTGSNGCDSTRVLTISVKTQIITSISENICGGMNFAGYTSPGTFIDTFTSSGACDSIRTLNLTVSRPVSKIVHKRVCPDSSFAGYFTPGVYIDTFSTGTTCDSIRWLYFTKHNRIEPQLDTFICPGTSVVFEINDGAEYQWSTGDTSSSITLSPAVSNTYGLTITDQYSCVHENTFEISLYPMANANAGNDKSICIGKSTTLTASGGQVFNWSNGKSTKNIQVSPLVDTYYKLTVTNSNGCSDSDSVIVNVFELPNINLGEDTSICLGDSIEIFANGVGDIWWSTNGTGQSVIVVPIDTTVYSASILDSNGCNNSDTIQVNTFGLPEIDFSQIPSDICISVDEIILSAFPDGGVFEGIGIENNVFNPSIAGIGLNEIRYTYMTQSGCMNTFYAALNVYNCSDITETYNIKSFNLFPNPTNGKVYIELSGEIKENTSITLYSLDGSIIDDVEINDSGLKQFNSSFNLTDNAPGVYYVKLTSGDYTKVKRVVLIK